MALFDFQTLHFLRILLNLEFHHYYINETALSLPQVLYLNIIALGMVLKDRVSKVTLWFIANMDGTILA